MAGYQDTTWKDYRGHYYVDPGMWNPNHVTTRAQVAADMTGHAQVIHLHTYHDPCEEADHLVVDPQAVE